MSDNNNEYNKELKPFNNKLNTEEEHLICVDPESH